MHTVRRPVVLAVVAAVAVAVIAVVAVAASAGGSSGSSRAADSSGYRKDAVLLDGNALQSAKCRQWMTASAEKRDAIVEVLHDVVGGPTPYGPATALSSEDAHALFDRACAPRYARGFLLYQLYTRAAAFSGAMDRFQ